MKQLTELTENLFRKAFRAHSKGEFKIQNSAVRQLYNFISQVAKWSIKTACDLPANIKWV